MLVKTKRMQVCESNFGHIFDLACFSIKPYICFRRNCVNNPKCLSGLGERRLFNFKNEASSSLTEEEKRNLGSFAGLKNLGATCYVNSLLQVNTLTVLKLKLKL